MRIWLDRLYRYSGGLAALCIVAIMLLVLTQVLLNLVDRISALVWGEAIGLTLPSYADFTGFLLAAASFLALAYTLQAGGHIRINLVTRVLPKRVQHYLELLTVAVALLLTLFVDVYMIKLVHESWVYQDRSAGMVAVPLWIPQFALALGLAMFAVALLDAFYQLWRGQSAPWADKEEHLLQQVKPQGTEHE